MLGIIQLEKTVSKYILFLNTTSFQILNIYSNFLYKGWAEGLGSLIYCIWSSCLFTHLPLALEFSLFSYTHSTQFAPLLWDFSLRFTRCVDIIFSFNNQIRFEILILILVLLFWTIDFFDPLQINSSKERSLPVSESFKFGQNV